MSAAAIMMRVLCTVADTRRDRGLKTPADVRRFDRIRYGRDRRWNLMDIYRPKETKRMLPVIVSVHGGGYVYGGRKIYQHYCLYLAEQGFEVVNFDYRLAPASHFPAPVEDLNAVLKWISRYGSNYGMDRSHIFLVGDSAGAQIASQYAAMYANPAYRRMMAMKLPPVHISALGLNCGIYDLKGAQKLAKGQLSGLMDDYLTKDHRQWGKKLNVLDYITPAYPPVSLVSAPGDFLNKELGPMMEILERNHVRHTGRLYGTKETQHVFHLDTRSALAREAIRDQLDFFRQVMAAEAGAAAGRAV